MRVVWDTSLSALLLSVAFLLTLRLEAAPRRRDWILAGLLWGTIALVNPSLLSFLPVSLGWLWFRLRGRDAHVLWRSALVCAVMLLMITPWLARNYRIFGQFVFIRDNFGLELRVANNPQSDGVWTRSEHPANDPEQMRDMQRIGELPYMRAMQRAALEFIRENPGTFAIYTLKRIAYFWMGKPQWVDVAGYDLAPARHMAFLITTIVPIAGLWLAFRRQRRGAGLFASLLLVFPLPYSLAHATPRYRHPIEPIMLLLAVYLFYEARNIRVGSIG